jgi:LmbE family N-acetylglucosaminyl deacetylase
MERSARLFGASVEFYGWTDLFYAYNKTGVDRTIREWSHDAGGRHALVARLEQTLKEWRPQIVFTLDPRHGSSCHSAHRATALLLLEAIKQMPTAERPDVWFEETDEIEERSNAVASTNKHFGYSPWPQTAAQTFWFDANQRLKDGHAAYDYVQAVLEAHQSQFPELRTGDEAADAPSEKRFVPLASLAAYRPADYCTPLKLDRPTLDIAGNKERLGIK